MVGVESALMNFYLRLMLTLNHLQESLFDMKAFKGRSLLIGHMILYAEVSYLLLTYLSVGFSLFDKI